MIRNNIIIKNPDYKWFRDIIYKVYFDDSYSSNTSSQVTLAEIVGNEIFSKYLISWEQQKNNSLFAYYLYNDEFSLFTAFIYDTLLNLENVSYIIPFNDTKHNEWFSIVVKSKVYFVTMLKTE